ncbi:U11/U12 small nuclear ribonucleoprotein 48 kDa protein-like [Gadus chalcogrammus]|uniref:U11/U12 small nuclear ribonucleoprotein 48 kDa protein-like n=1 Tax=Gadus chalcogrammus TaxID=1042646 RepID=UPI0024C4862B|nr:U11/U12 small nuclear ribonucleoprotein 48 kDa protein-like [Gadus chalcogrammus]
MTDTLGTQTVEERLGCLQELTKFTENCQKQLNDILETLGWSPEYDGSAQETMVQCPFDPNHRIPVRSLERHKSSCSLSKMGYSAEEQEGMYDSSVCYEKSNIRSVTMDEATQQQVILKARAAAPLMRMEGVFWQGEYTSQPLDVPQNHKRALCDLTVADRLALYDHVTGELNQQQQEAAANEDLYVDLVAKLKRDEQQGEPKSHLELMAEKRDYKRRRQSYRAKNVHITKKSYTEVIREVIKVHSGELAREWKEESCEEEKEKAEKKEKEQVKEKEEEERGSISSSKRRRSDDECSESRESQASHDRSRQRSRKHSPEREDRKRKKRDSGSPDERHHERKKKKKKKKKDEKEK